MKFQSLKLKQLSSIPEAPQKILILASLASLSSKAKYRRELGDELSNRVEALLARQDEKLKKAQAFFSSGRDKTDPDVLLVVADDELSAFESLELFRKHLKTLISTSAKSLGVVFLDLKKNEKTWAEHLGAALAVRVFLMPAYGKRAKDQKKYQLSQTSVFASQDVAKDFHYGYQTGEASNRIRSWGCTPPNKMNPEDFGKLVKSVCQAARLNLKFHSKAELKKKGAGAFTAVDQGNPDSKGGIYEISYSPKAAKNKKHVALVGKGLCFDTGGYDIKTAQGMIGMKGDMQGAAVALSSLLAIASLKLPLKVKAYLAVTENHISPVAYKADEVIVSLNGTAIEVVNTDAEGRMVLADTLTLATQSKPDLVIDFATLTGMAVYSIGTNYAAGFTNQDAWHSEIVECGKRSGERVWTFPIDKDYNKPLESTIADTLQCSKSRGVDHILGAVFLQKFLENDTPWIHIDLSAAERAGGLAHVDTEYTGFGARWTLEFLRNKYKLSRGA